VQAQGFAIDAPGVHVRVGERHRHYYRDRYNDGYNAYDYAPGWRGYGYNDSSRCPPHYTVQDGVCKPYRGY
jgi:hypothetical protein